ncbi:beta-N-acetylhexosaminidase [Thermopetrobacter sp. TC1]|uniref:beta-N-acetylhexosaminidase n=1 Tax=Thermopetrobacter sp. TC1 TaxID=1495045 RepID=UPI001E563735|nr:beta-N-acetylhexosaminidase [Thermopetrobacter sp. TC1]
MTMHTARAFICGCSGPTLTEAERAFFVEARPWGLILFARNIETPEQVRALIADFRRLVGNAQAPVFVDQEGGRVQRLKPPHWQAWPPAFSLAKVYEQDPLKALKAARLLTRALGREIRAVGFNADCLPVLDVPAPGSHEIIGDRAYGRDPLVVALLARAAMQGLMEAGVAPVIKHIPGHGRAKADSHETLPRVDAPLADLEAVDFLPFTALADAPMAMTAHVVYTAVDPDLPATHSAQVIGEIIRGRIGFSGLLMSDDITMKALSGSIAERAEKALRAGCDVILHCSGNLAEMQAVADVTPPLAGAGLKRAQAVECWLHAVADAPFSPLPEEEAAEREAQEIAALKEQLFALMTEA